MNEAAEARPEAEGAIPWNDSEGHDSPHDLAWFLRDKTEVTEDLDSRVDYVTSVARMENGGAAFLVKFQTGKRLRVTVTEEPSVRFYPAEGEPDERERKEFREAFVGGGNVPHYFRGTAEPGRHRAHQRIQEHPPEKAMRFRKRRCPKHHKLLIQHAAAPSLGLTWMWSCPERKCNHIEYSRRKLREM